MLTLLTLVLMSALHVNTTGADWQKNLHYVAPKHPLPDDVTLVQYRAAATQYRVYSNWGVGGAQYILDTNFETMLRLAANASLQDVDLIVFPEYGLTGTNLGQNRSMFRELVQVVPDPADDRVPCTEEGYTDSNRMVQSLSCLALELDLYIVADLAEIVEAPLHQAIGWQATQTEAAIDGVPTLYCAGGEEGGTDSKSEEKCEEKDNIKDITESDGSQEENFIAYNTQVVFDRRGAVVARYRKKHLFMEPDFEYGTEEDYTALFTTDFGVTFTLQVCFDIVYLHPASSNAVQQDVRDSATSTAWVDELPFLTALQIFSGWSKGMGVNLVISNLFQPERGGMGSGIFHSDQATEPLYTYDAAAGSPTLLVDDVVTAVSGDRMADFKEAEIILIDRKVKGIMKLLKFEEEKADSNIPNLFLKITLNNTNIGEKIDNFLREVGERRQLRRNVDKALKLFLRNVRQVVEWDRYSNRKTCAGSCQRIRTLLAAHKDANSAAASSGQYTSVPDNGQPRDPEAAHRVYQFIIHENITFYTHKILQPIINKPPNETIHAKACHLGTFCCHVSYSFYSNSSEESSSGLDDSRGAVQMLLAYNGTIAKGSGVYDMWTQVCAVVYCTSSDVTDCANIDSPQHYATSFRLKNISAKFDTNYVYPSVFDSSFSLTSNYLWSFMPSSSTSDGSDILQVDGDVDNMLTAALFGRWFSLDP